jgi:alkylation response protein AidB-like acyl-CoA dehydrogenase
LDFNLSEEQKLLRDSLAGYLARNYGFDDRRAAEANGGWRRDIWGSFATELGLFGVSLTEAEGGFGGGPIETMLIAEEFGRALVIEPYVESVVVALALLRDAGAEASALRMQVAQGTAIVAPALYESGGRFNLGHVRTRADQSEGVVRLQGSKIAVAAAPLATHVLVSAVEPAGVSLFLCDSDTVERRDYRLIDGRPAADLQLDAVPARLIGTSGDALPRIERAIDEGIAALCAEAVGLIDAMLRQTVDYTKQRKQFGVPIASFQVLQHRMADMLTLLERARSMSVMAALSLELPSGERRHAVSAAKAFVSNALKSVGENAIQLHGGIGTTEELAISHYFKRATVIASQFGTAAHHLARMSEADAA